MGTKISDLTALLGNDVVDGDLFAIVDVSAGITKKITRAEAQMALSPILSSTVTLTAADLADLANTPFEVVPAPGSGKILLPLSSFFITKDSPGSPGGPAQAVLMYGDSGIGVFSDPDGADLTYMAQNTFSQPSKFGSFGMIPSAVRFGYDGFNDPADIADAAIVLRLYTADEFLIRGAIVTSAIAAAGTGYVALEELTIGDATIRIDTVGGSGEVLTYTVTVAGTNNVIGTAQATTGGSGADFTVDITALNYAVNPMTLTVKTLYSVMDV